MLPCSSGGPWTDVTGEITTCSEFSAGLAGQRQKAHLSALAEPTMPELGEVETVNPQVAPRPAPPPSPPFPGDSGVSFTLCQDARHPDGV